MKKAKVKPAKKVVIYDFTTGQFVQASDITDEERAKAAKDIAATFYDRRLPVNATMVIWERGKVRSIATTPTLVHTKKLFYKEDGTLYPADI